MPITTLDPKTALIVIDLQNSMMAAPTVHPMPEVVKQASLLADAFRRHSLPVVLVNVGGGAPGRIQAARPPALERAADWNAILPQMNQQPSDHLVTKRAWGAFTTTDLDAWLKGEGVTQVVICGVATSIGCESTARSAHELGYNVTLAIDAMSDPNADCYTNSVMRIFPRLGETGTTAEIVKALDGAA